MNINYTLLPLKAHFFFSMAAIGAIFPFLPVYGKQLGISPLIIGSIGAILPIICTIAKPTFDFIMDYFQTQKKLIFMTLLAITSSSYILIYFLPPLPRGIVPDDLFRNVSCASLPSCAIDSNSSMTSCDGTENITCHFVCMDTNFSMQLSVHAVEKETVISPNTICVVNINDVSICPKELKENYNCNVTCDNLKNNNCLYTSTTFWGFVLLMSIGNIGFNIFYTLNSTICFGIIGKGDEMKYAIQYVWGEMGYGLAALLTGYTVNIWYEEKTYETYSSAFLLVFVFICIDLICCSKLKLPHISRTTNILADVCTILKFKSIVILSCFVIIVGALDGYLLYFLLWYEEELAIKTDYMRVIKLIEGITLCAQCLSSIMFSFFSDTILKKIGYGYTFTLCLTCYALRLGLSSVAPTPWWIVLIEFLVMGPSTTLSYVTIVTLANAISPPSIHVSVLPIMTGMKHGFGFAIGNLVGGILLKKFGGAFTLKIFSIFAAFCTIVYFQLYITYLKQKIPDSQNNVEWNELTNAPRYCVVENQ